LGGGGGPFFFFENPKNKKKMFPFPKQFFFPRLDKREPVENVKNWGWFHSAFLELANLRSPGLKIPFLLSKNQFSVNYSPIFFSAVPSANPILLPCAIDPTLLFNSISRFFRTKGR